MKPKPDPKFAARAELDRARLRLMVAVMGLGAAVEEGRYYTDDDMDLLLEFVHEDLEPVIDRVKRANKAMEPYWRRHRRRIRRYVPKKKKVAA